MSLAAKPCVLIVDDEPHLRELLSDALEAGQYELLVAGSGREAIDLGVRNQPDLIVTDLCLGDCSGMDVIDQLRQYRPDTPAVLITGHSDLATLSLASQRRPVELMAKPLDLERLRRTVRQELDRQVTDDRMRRRVDRLRLLARTINVQRKGLQNQLDSTCSQLTQAYRQLSKQMGMQKSVMGYQQELIAAKNDDDVFRALFTAFVHNSGPVYGAAMVCDANAELQLAGRFGVPGPDSQTFCLALSRPVIEDVLVEPKVKHIDAMDQLDRFPESVRRYLVGLSILAIPLIPSEGQMIGLVLLYRKGEQPFLASDLALADQIAKSTATAVQRND